MNKDILRCVEKFLKSFNEKHENDVVNVQFHGGEPMIYDVNAMSQLVSNLSDTRILWSITTNLVYKLDAAKIEFFKMMKPYDEKPYIMTSWDYRLRFNGNQEELWRRNVLELVKNGIQVQPIVCISKQLVDEVSPYELLRMFKSININHVNFERLTHNGNAEENIMIFPTNRQADDWLYAAYIESKKQNFYVPLFECVEDSVNGFLNGCRARKCMCNVITINPDGTVSACPNIAQMAYGKIGIDGEIVEVNNVHERLISFEKNANISKCLLCTYYKYCNGDCCQLQYDDTGCPGMTKIYKMLSK